MARTAVGVVLATVLTLLSAAPAAAQTLRGPFAGSYSVTDLGAAPAVVLTSYGGLTFQAGQPNRLLIGGAAATPDGAIFAATVARDAAGHVSGFAGLPLPTRVASAPDI